MGVEVLLFNSGSILNVGFCLLRGKESEFSSRSVAMPSLDRTDCAILRELQKNARTQNKTLADRVGIAESTCLQRVRRLREQGVIDGYHAALRPEALGIGLQAMVSVQLESHSRSIVESFRESMRNRPEVVALYHLGGRTDFLLHVAVRDPEHLRDLILSAFTEREAVKQVETSLVFEREEMDEWPIYPAARE
jgi:DNA-binding Lrp family transcriptional regulator